MTLTEVVQDHTDNILRIRPRGMGWYRETQMVRTSIPSGGTDCEMNSRKRTGYLDTYPMCF